MIMCRFIDRFFLFFLPKPKKVEVVDPWTMTGGYVKMFRKEYEEIAVMLTNSTRTVSVRFIPNRYLVEFVNQDNAVIAEVTCTGETGIPDHMEVVSVFSKEEKQLFIDNIPQGSEHPQYLKIFFQPLYE